MAPDFIAQTASTLIDTYGSERIRTAKEGLRTLIRIDGVDLYPTCQPPATTMLLALDPAQPKPFVYVMPGQLLANGKVPKNSSVTIVGGESWMQFSFNIPWEERHGIMRFIAAARQRFSQHE